MDIDVYLPPIDPLHCTLFYDRNDTVMYQDMFNSIKGTNGVSQEMAYS